MSESYYQRALDCPPNKLDAGASGGAPGGSGLTNTGSGGGGNREAGGAAGGSGIVLVAYPT